MRETARELQLIFGLLEKKGSEMEEGRTEVA